MCGFQSLQLLVSRCDSLRMPEGSTYHHQVIKVRSFGLCTNNLCCQVCFNYTKAEQPAAPPVASNYHIQMPSSTNTGTTNKTASADANLAGTSSEEKLHWGSSIFWARLSMISCTRSPRYTVPGDCRKAQCVVCASSNEYYSCPDCYPSALRSMLPYSSFQSQVDDMHTWSKSISNDTRRFRDAEQECACHTRSSCANDRRSSWTD